MIAQLEGVMRGPVERRLAAILAADVAAYSRLMGADEEGTLERLKAPPPARRPENQGASRPHRQDHRRRVLVEFPSVVDAVRCAVEVQRAMVDRNAEIPRTSASSSASGSISATLSVDGDNIYGDGVNIAARLEALAEPGGICISRVVRDQIRDKLPYPFEDSGSKRQKHCTASAHLRAERGCRGIHPLSPAEMRPHPPPPLSHAAARIHCRGYHRGDLHRVRRLGGWPRRTRSESVQTAGGAPRDSPAVAARPPPRLSIVVLPFANLSNDPAQDISPMRSPTN